MVAQAATAPEENMALFFQTRERPELARSAQVKEARASVRLVERTTNDVPVEFAARLSSLMQRAYGEPSLQRIDDIVAELRGRREHLLSESARIQREIAEYAKLSQRTSQSLKIGTQHLLGLKERGESGVAASAQDDKTLEGQAEPTAPLSSSENTIRSLELKLERLEHGLAMPRDEDAIARTKALLERARALSAES